MALDLPQVYKLWFWKYFEGNTPCEIFQSKNPGTNWLSMKYDGKPIDNLVCRLRNRTLTGSRSGEGEHVCEELRKRMIDVCYLLGVR